MPRRHLPALVVVAAFLAAAPAGAQTTGPDVAALQVALGTHRLYEGDVDGIAGPATGVAIRRFQLRARLTADGVAGPRTRAALGWLGRPPYGTRTIGPGDRGWDVAALQFLLARHGFPSGSFDGLFGPHLEAALLRFQRSAGLPLAGVAGPATRASLARMPWRAPFAVHRPVAAAVGSRWGARGPTWHPGLDFPAASGTPVRAALGGVVKIAGYAADGYGNRVLIDHGSAELTLYAHLSAVTVRPGARVRTGDLVGRVGSTGFSTGPHLHFEVIVHGAETDPALAMVG